MKIRKAVIPVAGKGTRFLPATKSMPKEMMPIIDKPIIQYQVEEMVASGIEQIVLVTGWDKRAIEDHFDNSVELEKYLKDNNKLEYLDQIKKLSSMAEFIYIRQKGHYGNGTPCLNSKNIIGNEPFVYSYGDDLVKSEVPFTKQLIDIYKKEHCSVLGAQEVALEDVVKYGIVKLKEPGSNEVVDFIEKPSIEDAPSRLAVFGRFVFEPEIFEQLEKTQLGKGNELWMTDAITNLMKSGKKVVVKQVEGGRWFTTGDPLRYLIATFEYARGREDLWPKLEKYLQQDFK